MQSNTLLLLFIRRKTCNLLGLWDICPIKHDIGLCSVDPVIPPAYYFTLGWHGIFKSGWEYNSLQYICKCFPLLSKFPPCCIWNSVPLLTHPKGFAVSDVRIAYDVDGYLSCIAHALINVACVWLICLTHIPGGMVFWVPRKHKGNYMQVRIELVLFNGGRHQMIVITCSRNKECLLTCRCLGIHDCLW